MGHMCRVFQQADGQLRVVHPAVQGKLADEAEVAFYERVMRRAIEADPTLRGLETVDVDSDDLPPRDEPCAECGETHSVRGLWRLVEGRVALDMTLPNPIPEAAHRPRRDGAVVAEPPRQPRAGSRPAGGRPRARAPAKDR